MFENVQSHAELEQMAREEAARLEAQRIAEQKRQEEAEQAIRESIAKEQERGETVKAPAEPRQKEKLPAMAVWIAAAIVILIIVIFVVVNRLRNCGAGIRKHTNKTGE